MDIKIKLREGKEIELSRVKQIDFVTGKGKKEMSVTHVIADHLEKDVLSAVFFGKPINHAVYIQKEN